MPQLKVYAPPRTLLFDASALRIGDRFWVAAAVADCAEVHKEGWHLNAVTGFAFRGDENDGQEVIEISNDLSGDALYSTVSLFCGCGGLDLGFRGDFHYRGMKFAKQPFDIRAAYDFDAKCIATYRRNISQHGEVLDLSNYDPSSVPSADVLIGGFPCQDFATCGPRNGLNSDRGKLYRALLRYMDVHRPKVVVGENVPGLANIDKGRALETIVQELAQRDYTVKIWTLYAPDYGVPQSRTRIFIVAVRNDLDGFPIEPVPTHPMKPNTISWAIDDLIPIQDDSVPNQSQYFLASKAKKGNGQGDEKSKADQPSYTIRANAKSRVQFHHRLDRRLTVRECARIQTFPDSFVFPHSATTNVMQIGNAVPPMLGYVVASSISAFLRQMDVQHARF